ncbi:MAG TPA: NHL repeat-containing protein [Candidatus Limnocylindrales bacterium]|nr:NHL repeat-containing protein [Candidatus Limnocylindrales bacterium]
MTGIAATPDGIPVPAPEPQPIPDDGAAPPPAAEAPERDDRRRRRFLLLFLLLALLILLIGIALWYFLFRQPIPLPLPTTVDLPGYTTSLYGATGPMGVASSPDGTRVYVAQTGGDKTVVIFDGSGNRIGIAQPPAATTGDEHVPVWMALDPLTSDLYVSDRPTGAVYQYDRDGSYMRTVQLAVPIPGWQPMGLAFDAAGNLYVADLAGATPRVEEFDRSMNLVRTFGASDNLSFANGVAVDGKGNVYVADSDNGRVLVYRPDGTSLTQVGRGVAEGKLGMPRGLAIDGRGRLYIVDNTAQGVVLMQLNDGATPSLDYLGLVGGPGIEDGRFTFPNGVAADGRGRLYVTDTGNDRVQMWSY